MQQDSWRAIFGRGFSYAGEHAIRLALTAAVGIIVARYLGPEGLGLLSFAQSVFGLLAPIVLLGLPSILVREFSTGTEWRSTLASSLAAQAPVAVIAALAGFLVIALVREFETQAVLTAAAMAPLPILTMGRTVRSYLEAVGRSRPILMSGIVAAVVASVVKIAAVAMNAEVWVFALAGTIEVAVVAAVLLRGAPARFRVGALRRHASIQVVRDLTRESWPLLLSALAVVIYMRVDIVMLGLLADDQQTGIYAAAAQVSEVWYFLPMAAVAALRPLLSRLYAAGSHADYQLVLQRLMTVSAGVSYLAVIGVLLLGTTIVVTLYGQEYAGAAPVLQLHIFAAPFVFLGVSAGPWFIDRQLGRAVLVRSLVGAAVNVGLNAILIPSLGARGAAVSTLASYALGVLLNVLLPTGPDVFRLQLRAMLLRWRAMSPSVGETGT